jgi:hypothetical protein
MRTKQCLGCGGVVEPHNSVYAKMLDLMHRGFIVPLYSLLWHELCWVEKYSEYLSSEAATDAEAEEIEKAKKAKESHEHRG